MAQSAPVKVTNAELATVREAMRELPRLLAELDAGTIDKLVLTQRNQMRAVLVSVERYSALDADERHKPLRTRPSSSEWRPVFVSNGAILHAKR